MHCLDLALSATTTMVILFGAAIDIPGAEPQGDSADSEFNRLVDQYFDEYFRQHPTEATAAGLHEHDQQLEDYSRAGIEARRAMLKRFAAAFEKLDPQRLRPEAAADRELVRRCIQAQLLELEEIRSWEKNPDVYSSGVNYSVFVIMSRSFAPPAERLRAVVARERQVPAVLEAARNNLSNPPRIYTEIALEQLPGIIGYFQKDVTAAFRDVGDEKLRAEFRAANQAAVAALEKYQEFLRADLLARSGGDFRIGAENFRKKLLYEEMIDIPLDRLLEIGYADLRANRKRLEETAARVARGPLAAGYERQVLDELMKKHPKPDRLLETVRRELDNLRRFIAEHKIVTIPSPVTPIVEETPPFKRALSWASMETPGPFETKATEAYYFVTLPEPGWSPQRVEEHMQGFNYGTIASTSIHEAYPGHYVQFLWVQRAPSKVRKLLGAGTNAEGWAHYTEQMMLDEGYGRDDPQRYLELRMGQLQDALLRNCRYIVGIEMHTGKMTREQAVEFFVKEGYQPRATGETEAKRGTTDPTYLMYTLGKLAILKLRADYRKLRGEKYSLQEFHDALLGQGFPPIKLVRRALLGEDGGVLRDVGSSPADQRCSSSP